MASTTEGWGPALTALAPERTAVYGFLSAAFSGPPGPERIAAIRGGDFLASAAEIFSAETLAPLRQLAQSPQPIAELERQLRQEFMNLFKVPGAQYVTPYESVFRDARNLEGQPVKGLLMGQSAIDVQQWYRLAALDISPEFKDLPDHIALELNYLAQLCAKEQEFAADGDEAKLRRAWEMERDFLAAHVVSWAGALHDKIKENSQNLYFLAVAEMLADFTAQDLAALEEALGPSRRASAPGYATAPA